MRVKICGMTNVADALAAAGAGADFVGLILTSSPRRVTLEIAQGIVAALPPTTAPVLLFRDTPQREILAAIDATGASWVQLHGHEPVDEIRALRVSRPGLQVIKAWELAGQDTADALLTYVGVSDAAPDIVILDVAKGMPHPGHERFAELSRRCARRPPQLWLAGGLTPDTLASAVQAGRYDGVDVARGVESAPGSKDHAAVRRFIELARSL